MPTEETNSPAPEVPETIEAEPEFKPEPEEAPATDVNDVAPPEGTGTAPEVPTEENLQAEDSQAIAEETPVEPETAPVEEAPAEVAVDAPVEPEPAVEATPEEKKPVEQPVEEAKAVSDDIVRPWWAHEEFWASRTKEQKIRLIAVVKNEEIFDKYE